MEAKEEDKAHAHSPWVFSAKQCGKLMTAWKEHRALDFKLELYYSPLRLNPVCQRVEATRFRKKKKKRLNFEPQLWFLKHCYNCFWIGFWGWPLIRNIAFLRWRLSLKKGWFDYNELGWTWSETRSISKEQAQPLPGSVPYWTQGEGLRNVLTQALYLPLSLNPKAPTCSYHIKVGLPSPKVMPGR